MDKAEESRRAMDAALYKAIGGLEANVKTATAQTTELFGLVRELRDETPTKADFLALSIEQRNHMSVDMAEHGEFRQAMKGFAELLFDPHDDTKGIVPEHRAIMETHQVFKKLRNWAIFGVCVLPPGAVALFELWDKYLVPALRHALGI